VLYAPDPLRPGGVDAATFNWQMGLLARHFNVLPLMIAVKRLREGSLPARAVCITFDDGYADNAEIALPILQAWGLPATFFIATGYLNGGRMFNDTVIEVLRYVPPGKLDLSDLELGIYHLENLQARATAAQRIIKLLKYLPNSEREERIRYLTSFAQSPLSNKLMLSSQQVQKLHVAGMEIGAHTVNHPILANLEKDVASREIAEGKKQLEALIGEQVRLFAYPNGKPGQDYLPEHVDMVRELGFDSAVSTKWGVSTMQTDPWQLPRFTPWDTSPIRFMARLLMNCRFLP
jgi:peptidoglycan/xylan/chitin deacetylase (PgdA/CDA1 family)